VPCALYGVGRAWGRRPATVGGREDGFEGVGFAAEVAFAFVFNLYKKVSDRTEKEREKKKKDMYLTDPALGATTRNPA